jgi:equilibrative nucleoside transporter 1/2/3
MRPFKADQRGKSRALTGRTFVLSDECGLTRLPSLRVAVRSECFEFALIGVSTTTDDDGRTAPLLEHAVAPEIEQLDTDRPIQHSSHGLLFFLLGTASLMPFAAICNAIDIFRSASGRSHIATILSRSYNFPFAAASLLQFLLKLRSLRIAFLCGLSCLIVISFLFVALIAVSPAGTYRMTQVLVLLSGVFPSLIFTSTYSLLSQVAISAGILVSSGIGCGGVLSCGLRILTKTAFPDAKQQTTSSVSYFCLGAVVLVVILIYFVCVMRSPVLCLTLVLPNVDTIPLISRTTLKVFKTIFSQWFAVALNSAITLSLYPGFLTGVKELSEIGDWTPVLVTTLFCVFDWLGRHLPARYTWLSRKGALFTVIGRLIFYVPFVVSIRGVVELGDPMWTFCWLIPFAFASGYGGTFALIFGSNPEELADDTRQCTASLMLIAVWVGTITGMGITWILAI